MTLSQRISNGLAWVATQFGDPEDPKLQPVDDPETDYPRRTQGYTTVYNSDMFLKIPPFPISYSRMYEIAQLDPITRTCIYNLNLYSYMNGMEWYPRWTSKCPDCGTKYTGNTPMDYCPKCDDEPDDYYAMIGEYLKSGTDLTSFKNKMMDNGKTKRKMEYPNPEEYAEVEKFFKCCNKAGQTLVEVIKQSNIDWNTVDDGYIVMRKRYAVNKKGKSKGMIVKSKVIEIIRGAPYLIRKVVDQNNHVGGRWFKCLACQEKTGIETVFENEEWGSDNYVDKFSQSDQQTAVLGKSKISYKDGYARCPKCGGIAHDVIYFEMFTEMGIIQKFYIEGEIVHKQKFMPSTAYGSPPVLTTFIIQEALIYQNLYIRDWFGERKIPVGVLSVVTSNIKSFITFWKSELLKRKQDKQHIPIIPTEPEGTGFGGVGGVKWVDLQPSLAEMQYTDGRNEMRKRIESLWGISGEVRSDVGDRMELSEKERKTIENEQLLISEVLDVILPMFGIENFGYRPKSSDESGIMKRLDIDQREIQNMQMVYSMGFEVDRDANDIWHFWKKPISTEQEAMLQQLLQKREEILGQIEQQKVMDEQATDQMGQPQGGGDKKVQSYSPNKDVPDGDSTKGKQSPIGKDECPLCTELSVEDWELIQKCTDHWIDVGNTVVNRKGRFGITYKDDKRIIKSYDDESHANAVHYAIKESQKRRGSVRKYIGKRTVEEFVDEVWPGGPVADKFGKESGKSKPSQMEGPRAQGRTKTPVDQKSESGSTYTPGQEGQYACPHCGQTFDNKSQLGGHIKAKHGDIGAGESPEQKQGKIESANLEGAVKQLDLLIEMLVSSLSSSHRPTNTPSAVSDKKD